MKVPPSGGSLEIGNEELDQIVIRCNHVVPPSGGSLEIGNLHWRPSSSECSGVPPSGGSLEIGNLRCNPPRMVLHRVPPSGGSLEIGNAKEVNAKSIRMSGSPFGGIPRNWKLDLFHPAA